MRNTLSCQAAVKARPTYNVRSVRLQTLCRAERRVGCMLNLD
jgi:hypothetical protein